MKHVFTYIIALCVSLLHVGCGASRHVHTVADIEERAGYTDSLSISRDGASSILSAASSSEDRSSWRITYTFDTKQPSDPETNLPPLQSITAEGEVQAVQSLASSHEESSCREVITGEVTAERETAGRIIEDRDAEIGRDSWGMLGFLSGLFIFVVVFIWVFKDARSYSSE